MSFVLIDSIILFASIIGIAGFISYAYALYGDGPMNERGIEDELSKSLKDFITRLLARVHANRYYVYAILRQMRCAVQFIATFAMNKYAAFYNSMRGSVGDDGKKGAASFFLKRVSEHKKKFAEKR